ncbi:hypothetical protein K32_48060 [Kaistia sp. 32K]|nr:hypothetical protein K32_48060 [Kaistia sp. 32K]
MISRQIDLSTHIDDIATYVSDAGLRDITLVGHSYGGFPATVAAHRLGRLISHLVLLDAFLPVDGEMLLDHAPAMIERYRQAAEADDGWNIPPIPSSLFGVAADDQSWVDARLTPQPVESYFERVSLPQALNVQRKIYIRCAQAPGDLLVTSIGRVQSDAGWHYLEIDAPHDVMITHPELLARELLHHG